MHADAPINVFHVLAHRAFADSKATSDLLIGKTRTRQEIGNLALSCRQLRQQWVMSFSHGPLHISGLGHREGRLRCSRAGCPSLFEPYSPSKSVAIRLAAYPPTTILPLQYDFVRRRWREMNYVAYASPLRAIMGRTFPVCMQKANKNKRIELRGQVRSGAREVKKYDSNRIAV